MRPELKAIVKSFDLKPAAEDPVFSHTGTAGAWEVASLVSGIITEKGVARANETELRAFS